MGDFKSMIERKSIGNGDGMKIVDLDTPKLVSRHSMSRKVNDLGRLDASCLTAMSCT